MLMNGADDGPTMIEFDDATLVLRSRSGDRLAFEQLVRRTARSLFAKIYVDVADPHRTQDLVQETFLRAWKKLDSLSDPNLFRAWLHSITRSVVIDAGKREKSKKRGWLVRRKTGDEAELSAVADARPSPIESADASEQRTKLLQLLRELPKDYRDVLTLRYIAGADYDEIAKQLSISNGSLRGLLSRGMKLLREKMNEKDSPQMGHR
jgi:RNA polymerase sigma-70 factor (ECF subfamily)